MGSEVRHTLCRMCDDRCGIAVHLENGRIVAVEGDRGHKHSRGRLCIKAQTIAQVMQHPDRLTVPLRRTARGWVEVDLEEALDDIAERLLEVGRRFGRRSVGIWKGEAIGFAQQEGLARRFAHAVGTPNYLSNDSMCFNTRYLGFRFVQGAQPVPDYEQADCVVVWGSNPPASLPNVAHAIGVARRRGAPLVVIDPRRSKVAQRATVHARVRPGTDGALAWALVRELIESGACDNEFISKHTVGFREVAAYSRAFTPERAEAESGVPAAEVREIARLMARAAPAVAIYPGNGLEHHVNGVDTVRVIAMFAALLGAVDQPGGSRFLKPPPLRDLTLYDEVPLDHLSPLGADQFPALYSERQECHTMTAVGAMLDSEPYPLRALVVTGGNPALTHPNSARVARALAALDLLVVRDLFMSETAALAEYVLPAASFLERSELHAYPEQQALALSDRVVSQPGAQTEYEFWRALARRMGAGSYFPWEDERALNRWLLEPTGLSIEELEAHRGGVSYVPPGRGAGFDTPSGKIELVSQQLLAMGHAALPEYRRPDYLQRPDRTRPFVLITGARGAAVAHSRFRGLSDEPRDTMRAEVELHPADAEALEVRDGDVVRLSSRVGTLDAPARVMAAEDILPGVVQLTHGGREANANLLTYDDVCDPISGFPAVKEVEISVEKVPAAV